FPCTPASQASCGTAPLALRLSSSCSSRFLHGAGLNITKNAVRLGHGLSVATLTCIEEYFHHGRLQLRLSVDLAQRRVGTQDAELDKVRGGLHYRRRAPLDRGRVARAEAENEKEESRENRRAPRHRGRADNG